MAYVIQGTNAEVLSATSEHGHTLSSYQVRVSPLPQARWASVICSCGSSAKASWEDTTSTFRDLVYVAWFDACGSIARLGAESLPQSRE
jgi:hypothetical protein